MAEMPGRKKRKNKKLSCLMFSKCLNCVCLCWCYEEARRVNLRKTNAFVECSLVQGGWCISHDCFSFLCLF